VLGNRRQICVFSDEYFGDYLSQFSYWSVFLGCIILLLLSRKNGYTYPQTDFCIM